MTSVRSALFLVGTCTVAFASATPKSSGAAADTEFFEQKIRPVLADKCFECHSAEAKSLKGNLLLDSREGLLKGGDTGPAFEPGKPGKSLLLSAIHYEDPDTAMPPKKSGGKLAPEIIADFTAWLTAGAPWPEAPSTAKKTSKKFDLAQRKQDHWCWKAPTLQPTPAVLQKNWPRSLSDAFVLAKLEAAHLQPAPPADKGTLLRRITFDLTGLPPTPAELEAFQTDTSPAAFERVVDQLLASPHFGERWARHWMDLVRYAESRGHEFDYPIPNAWQYRDYLVRAFNTDVPYNQFIKEHLAGDLLPARLHPTSGANESVLGTGFWFLTEEVHSPVDLRQDEVDRMDNRVDVMAKSFLGLTVACARCHDHKFDAISQKDYYALTGFLISSSQRLVRFETCEQERKTSVELAQVRAEIAPALLRASATAVRPALERSLPSVLEAARKALPTLPQPAPFNSEGCTIIADYTRPNVTPFLQDGFAFGNGPVQAGTVLPGASAHAPVEGIVTQTCARRDEAWKDIKPNGDGDPGALNSFQRSGQSLRTPEITLGSGQLWYLVRGAGHAYAVVNSHLMVGGPLHHKVLATWKDTSRWEWVSQNLTGYPGQRAHIELLPDGTGPLEVAMVVESATKPPVPAGFAAGRATPAASNEAIQALLQQTLAAMEANSLADVPHLAPIADWLMRSLDQFCPPNSQERLTLTATTAPLIERHNTVAAAFKRESQVASAMFDGTGTDEFQLKRGSPKMPMAAVPRRFLEAIAGPEPLAAPTGSGRLQLAELVASPENPLTSRVIVNRVWQHLFGRGIVPTVDNFGVLGQAPTHQELLDTLAVRFATEQGWSLKKLIRELVLSSTYAMSSSPTSAPAEEADPQNLLLHRMNLKRLEGEAIRDSILAVSGRLDAKLGGPSVPIHITPFMDGRGKPKSGPLDGDGRRSLYIAIKRNFLSPMMLAFDTPIPFNTMGRRNVSNVPAQSLVLMNDPFVIEQADLWAKSLPTGTAPAEKLRRMYFAAFARAPLPEESADALAFLSEQANALGASPEDPRVWADLAHVLFNAKEFIHLN